jgi:hypothetical protein
MVKPFSVVETMKEPAPTKARQQLTFACLLASPLDTTPHNQLQQVLLTKCQSRVLQTDGVSPTSLQVGQ